MSALVTSMLDRVLAPWADALTRESAEQILRFQLDAETRQHIDRLAGRAAEGALTEIEQREYGELVDAIDLLGILKAKARDTLTRRAQP